MSTERLLRLRKFMNRKRPKFLHQEHWKLKRFKKASWRKPKGKRSKMRVKEKAKPVLVSIGYRGPRKVRGWHPKGSPEVMVHNARDIARIIQDQEKSKEGKKTSSTKKKAGNEDTDVVIRIASSVGTRKKIDIMKAACEHNLHVVNPQIKQVILTVPEDVELYLPIKKYIATWRISEGLTEEEREEIQEEAEDKGVEVAA
ncbi:MAG: hypothetical protein HXS47_06150 [Theionarchaea archaeon]|nr:hypothetical protein [Theionarchaea archaeon]